MRDYWHIILEEVAHYSDKNYRCRYSNLQETDVFVEKTEEPETPPTQKKQKVTYPLPEPFSHLHLTEREAECVFCMQNNHTIRSAAILLNLSARTVEFYLKNIKTKLNIRTKTELLDCLQQLDFFEFDTVHGTLEDLMRYSKPTFLQKDGTKKNPEYKASRH